MNNALDFSGKVALVAGAAEDMGLATTTQAGAAVVLADFKEDAVKAAAQEVVAHGVTGMRAPVMTALALAFLASAASSPASAETLRSNVAFNTGIGKKTDNQPPNGIQVAYRINLKGGELDGCPVDIIETFYPRNEGAWGIFDVSGKVACANGDGFAYNSSGAWDSKGFRAAGSIVDGSGSGRFANAKGRVAQLGGTLAPASGGTADVSFELVVDTAQD